MSLVTTPSALKSAFRIERLEPFGLLIEARRDRQLRAIDAKLLDSIARREKLVCLRGFAPLTREELVEYGESYPGAGLLHWDTGPVMEMRVLPEAKNYLFTAERVPFHWDGAFHRVPSYLFFHCIQAPLPDCGGETLFCDTERVWRRASEEERTLWTGLRLTYRTAKLAHYGGSITVPMAQKHPRLGTPILRFAEPVETKLNPVSLDVEGLSPGQTADFLGEMARRIYNPAFCYAHRWEQGDYLIADNHALIHGRNAFTRDCPRHLRRVQIL